MYIDRINVVSNEGALRGMYRPQHELNLHEVKKEPNHSPVLQHRPELICSVWVDSTRAHFVCEVKHVQGLHGVECTRIDSCRDEPTRVIPQYNSCKIHSVFKITHPRCIPLWICVAYHCLYAHYGGTSGRNYILQRHDGNVAQTHDHNMVHCTKSLDICILALFRPSEYNIKWFHMLVGVVAI